MSFSDYLKMHVWDFIQNYCNWFDDVDEDELWESMVNTLERKLNYGGCRNDYEKKCFGAFYYDLLVYLPKYNKARFNCKNEPALKFKFLESVE